MKAMIFAAGFGKRLLPLTRNLPKALVRVKDRPMLDWAVEYLTSYGIDEIVINTHYLHDQIESFLGAKQYPIPVKISHEEEILGTGGGLFHTRNYWGEDDFLAGNVDTLCNADLTGFIEHHRSSDCIVSLAVNDRVLNSMMLIDETGNLVGRKKNGLRVMSMPCKGRVREVNFCGLHLISPKLFTASTEPAEFCIVEHYLKLVGKGIRISTWDIGSAYWEDVGTTESLDRANMQFPGHSKNGG
ncbi:MAG: NTP transferase domain-containing protein [Proteobacteria bacterium]|nr:NTP transferase domain-containing protein [Pseudomonadota bacterium]